MSKKKIDTANGLSFRTIDEVCRYLGTESKKMGFLRAAWALLPNEENTIVWCPSVYNKLWSNSISDDKTIIREYRIDETKRLDHVNKYKDKNQLRVTFYKDKNAFRNMNYNFIGVFEIDKVQSEKECKCIWKRVSDRYSLK